MSTMRCSIESKFTVSSMKGRKEEGEDGFRAPSGQGRRARSGNLEKKISLSFS